MKKRIFCAIIVLSQLLFANAHFAQTTFKYSIVAEPFRVDGLPGLHSFSIAQYGGKWLIIGGRTDGLHPRMPMNSFSSFKNNTSIYVVDPLAQKVWSRSVNDLPTSIKEQLQSSNPNYYQDKDTLYYIGGYAFSRSADAHITFPYLTTVYVSKLIQAVIENKDIHECFKQINDTAFAVTGGQLVKIGEQFYLVGGHRFDGTYNPEGQPSFTQRYTNQVRRFSINNSANQLSISDYSTITDALHLHRRDYNLIPQLFADGSEGYCISSGVFQYDVNKPFYYPVDITRDSIKAYPYFNQYLTNYHTAHVALYERTQAFMYTLFFGGMGVGSISNQEFTTDTLVPFVNTISVLTRTGQNDFEEYALPSGLPLYTGAASAFLFNENLPHTPNHVLLIDESLPDTVFLGYLIGGILSKTENPFTQNETARLTEASATHYKIYLLRSNLSSQIKVNGVHPYTASTTLTVLPKKYIINFSLLKPGTVRYYRVDAQGHMVHSGKQYFKKAGTQKLILNRADAGNRTVSRMHIIFEDRYFVELMLPR
jgi:hypothetical protein